MEIRPRSVDLDLATQSGSGWMVSIWGGAGEATVSFVGPRRRPRQATAASGGGEKAERDADLRRTRTIRRFVVANDLGMLATLTFGTPPNNFADVYASVERFLHRLRSEAFGSRSFPWLYVVQRGAVHGRLHAHVLLPRIFPGFVHALWDLGTADAARLRCDADRRRAAAYVSVFASSEFLRGQQRYRVAKGFSPKPDRVGGLTSAASGVDVATDRMGRSPDSSYSVVGFGGVPVQSLRWDSDVSRGAESAPSSRAEHRISDSEFLEFPESACDEF